MPLEISDTINFGRVFLYESQDLVIRLRNGGLGDPLTISPLEVVGAGFTVVSQPAETTLAAGASTVATLRFAPTGNFSARTGSLTVLSNDPSGPRSVLLTGECVDPFRYNSVEGPFQVFGVTEFGDLSDPPRKYLLLESNKAAVARRAPSLAPDIVASWNRNRSSYDEAGNRVEQIAFVGGDITSGVLADVPKQLGSASDEALNGAGNSFEDVDQPVDWLPYSPTWVRGKTAKSYSVSDLSAAPSETRYVYHVANSFLRVGGLLGTARGLGMRDLTWVTNHWEAVVDVGGDGVNIGTATGPSAYMRLAAGDRDPGNVTTSDIFIGKAADQIAGAGNCGGSFPISLPPDCSVRFLLVRGATSDQIPQQIDTRYTNGSAGPSGIAIAAYDGWLHLPSSDSLPWKYESRLVEEDTISAALDREAPEDVVRAHERVAQTSSLSGGVTAESAAPIDGVARVITLRREWPDLLVGHQYQITIALEDEPIGGGEVSSTSKTHVFLASSTTQTEAIELSAPVGFDRRVVSYSIVDQGAAPVPPDALESETLFAYGRVLAAGSTWSASEISLANTLVVDLKAALGSSYSKLNYFMPLIGPNLTAALVPLIDTSHAGLPTNTGFVNGDFSESTGLQGNGSSKLLTLPLKPSVLGASNNGGAWWWELNMAAGLAGSTGYPFGCYTTSGLGRFLIVLEAGKSEFRWGLSANGAIRAVAPANACYTGRRSSSTSRTLLINGVSVATNTTLDNAAGATATNLRAVGDFSDGGGGNEYWAGRCGLILTDDGTLTNGEVASVYSVLQAFITATGRG